VIAVDEVYFQCARAIVRSDLWNPAKHADPKRLPTPGAILASLSENRVGGKSYDDEWPAGRRRRCGEHDPEKCEAVFRKDHTRSEMC